MIIATRPNPGGQSITHDKGAIGLPANNAGVVVYKEWGGLVKDQLVARIFTLLADLAIGEFQQILAGMRRLRPVCDQLATESAANNVPRVLEADEGTVPLFKDSMSKLTTTMNKQLKVVPRGRPARTLGQQRVPTVQVIVLQVLLPLRAATQWGPARADPNPAPVHKNSFPAIHHPQAQRQVRPGAVPSQAPVVPGVVQGQPEPQVQGAVVPIIPAQGQLAPGVVPGQPQPQAPGEVVPVLLAQAQLAPGVAPGQPQPPIKQPQAQ